MTPNISASRIIIQGVYPEVDCGQYPVKRIIGENLEVWADIFTDGHDLINAVLSYEAPRQRAQHILPMEHQGNDRWRGSFALDNIGLYRFTIRAWIDSYGSWLRDTRKKQEAKQDIDLELQEGSLLLQKLLNVKIRNEPAFFKTCRLLLKSKDYAALAPHLLSDEIADCYREHGPRLTEVTYHHELQVRVDRRRAEFSAWYEMFPRSQGLDPTKSGTFADCEKRLDDIQAMGFDTIYFPPIHPIGNAFRKGRNNSLEAAAEDPGSPYAIGSPHGGHKSIHPDLGKLDDFRNFVKAAKMRGMDVALDFAVQVSPDHPYVKEHPEWFSFRPDGSLKYAENPPKKYQDIANVNFDSGKTLWEELRSVIDYWIEQGVTIFRVDNPHTKPFAFWQWLIAGVQDKHPEIIFLAEAFTRPKPMYALAKVGFTQSYSYFTWRNSKQELVEYLTELTTDWPKEYFRPNFFPTTPDIFPSYLHKSGRPGFIIRLTLAATLSSNYGIYSGYELCEGESLNGDEEYLDSEKYEIKVRDWDASGNIKAFVTQLNAIRHANPALQTFKNLRFHPANNDQILFYSKTSPDHSNIVFIAVNLDPYHIQEASIELPLGLLGIEPTAAFGLEDLLMGHSWQWRGAHQHLRLVPEDNPVAIFRIQNK